MREADTLNVELRRSCPMPRGATPFQRTALEADGTFEFSLVRPGKSYVVVHAPGVPLQIRRVQLVPGKAEVVDVAVEPGGTLSGHVADVPSAIAGRLWVVAFDADVVRRDTRIKRDGSFQFQNLPPGQYGLRVGHDAYALRRDAYREEFESGWSNDRSARPWAGVDKVTVKNGKAIEGVDLSFDK